MEKVVIERVQTAESLVREKWWEIISIFWIIIQKPTELQKELVFTSSSFHSCNDQFTLTNIIPESEIPLHVLV